MNINVHDVGSVVRIGRAEYTIVASQAVADAQFQVKKQEGNGGAIAPQMLGKVKLMRQYVLMIDPATLPEGQPLENPKPVSVSSQELESMAEWVHPPRAPQLKLAEPGEELPTEKPPTRAEAMVEAAGRAKKAGDDPIPHRIGSGDNDGE